MTYDEALEYIHKINWRGSKRGLSRTEALLAKLGSPEKRLKFVHVAGTNGKGSTCAIIESVLREAGYRTGLYTSPFIARFNERIRVNGEAIGDAELASLVERVRPFAEEETDKPTEFELITALGFLYFLDKRCDIVVLEVGLGGEFDSTNVIPAPEAAVITALGIDHVQQLGSDIRDIARAKAGIIKDGTDVVIYEAVPEADEVISDVCAKKGATLHRTDFSGLTLREHDLEGCRFDFGGYKDLYIPLAGTYQPMNAAVAITALNVLRGRGWEIEDSDIYRGMEKVRWQGRFELISRHPTVILDGGHNPHGIKATAKSLWDNIPEPEGQIVFLTGVMADKDVRGMVPELAPLARCFVTVTPDNPRSLPADEYAAIIRSFGLEAEPAVTIEDGARRALDLAGENGTVCALGSLYFSSDVREAFRRIKTT